MKRIIFTIVALLSMTMAQAQQGGERGERGERGQGRQGGGGSKGGKEQRAPRMFDMVQTLSYGAQTNTIAFSALAFYTGSLYSSSFYPPGKVADYFGFQYMRDNDLSESGHNTDFLTKAAWHTMSILNSEQLQILIDLAEEQEQLFRNYALARLTLIDGFHRYLDGDTPKGTTTLDKASVKELSRKIYLIDGEISYGRSIAFAKVINSLTKEQVAYLQRMSKEGMQSWTMPERPAVRVPRGLNVWVMSNASELFSWYLRDVEADVYFCPERQGTYFGGFYMKDAPAVGNPGYAIDPQATSGKGKRLLREILTEAQAAQIIGVYDTIRYPLHQIVDIRQKIATELRRAIEGKTPDKARVMELSGEYGEADGEYIYAMVDAFVKVGRTLTKEQRAAMKTLRELEDYPDKQGRVFIYSQEVATPQIESSDPLFR